MKPALGAGSIHVEGYANQLDSTDVPRDVVFDAAAGAIEIPARSVVWMGS